MAENEKLKKDIRRLTESARKTSQWADHIEATKIGVSGKAEKGIDWRAYTGEKSRRMQMRRKNLERRQNREIDEKSELLKNLETVDDLKLFPLTHYKENLVIMEDVALSYGDGHQDKKIIEDFNLEILQGERIFLQGKNGCGKSSIIKAILSQYKQKGGNGKEMPA